MTNSTDRPAHLRGLSDDQVALYHRVNHACAAAGVDFWTTLRAAQAPAADKYDLAEAMGYPTVADGYAEAAGRDSHRGRVAMTSLAGGDRFIGPDGRTRYEVTTPAAEHPRGWVNVRDLSMTDMEAAERAAQNRWDSPDTDGRDGFFAYSVPVYVHRLDPATDQTQPVHTAQPVDDDGDEP